MAEIERESVKFVRQRLQLRASAYRAQNIRRTVITRFLLADGLIVGDVNALVDILGDQPLHQVAARLAQKFARIVWIRWDYNKTMIV